MRVGDSSVKWLVCDAVMYNTAMRRSRTLNISKQFRTFKMDSTQQCGVSYDWRVVKYCSVGRFHNAISVIPLTTSSLMRVGFIISSAIL
jgi:hypothetical protein